MKIPQMKRYNYQTYRRVLTVISAATVSVTCDLLGILGSFEKAIIISLIISLYAHLYAQKHILN